MKKDIFAWQPLGKRKKESCLLFVTPGNDERKRERERVRIFEPVGKKKGGPDPDGLVTFVGKGGKE